MRESVYHARREMFETLDIPVTKADVKRLRWKQRSHLLFWETALRSLLAIKRMVDIAVSLVALVLLLPLYLFVAILILIDDGFPVLLLQKRVVSKWFNAFLHQEHILICDVVIKSSRL